MGGGKGSNTTKSTFKLPPEFIKAYSESLGLARQAIQQPYTPYTGQLVAGLTPGQQQGIANIQASQGMALPFIQEGAGLTREAARGITPELYKQYYSPYIRDVAEATQANLLESAARQRSDLKSGAIGAGAFGGDRSGIAQAEMARQQQMANAQNLSNIYEQGYRNAMGLAGNQVQNLGAMGNQLAGMGTTAQTSALQGAQAQLAAGATEQATDQAQLQAAYDQFLQLQSYPFQIAQFFANIAQGLGSTAGGTSSTTAPGPNAGSQILGGLGAIANIAGALPSDKRAKENIEAVGTLNDGQTVYRYNFKGDPKTQIGLLAQEVEQRNPGAVTEVKGLKMVDYKGATDDAASSMGGVVGPGDDRQGFMNGGMPYGGVGFVPNNPMMAGASSKIPGAATPAPDAGLAGAADMTQPFTDQQKQGVANIAGLFQKPSIYNAGGVVGRNSYADGGGGVPFMPYSGARGWVPEGKMGGGGDRIAERAPKPFEDTGLSEDWQAIKPLTDAQASNLRQLPGRIRGMFADPDMAAATYMTQPSIYETYDPATVLADKYGGFTEGFASGGVAGRGGYQYGGEPTMEEAMAEAEAMREPQGVAGGDYTRLLQKESGNNFAARNKQGYVGRAQFGDARLEDARRAGVLPEGMDKESFRLNPNAQKAVEDWHFSDINSFIDNRGLGAFEGKTVGGIPVTREGLVNVAHLGGKGGLEKFITSGGRYNPVDANGTRLSDYLAMGAQSGGVGAATAPSGYSDTQIMPVSAEAAPEGVAAAEQDRTPFNFKNLFASDERPSIVEQVLGRRLSPEARSAMLNASFALMAGRSPFFFSNLGEAGRVGTQTYYNALQQKRELEKQRADIARQGFEAETGRMQAVNPLISAMAEINKAISIWASDPANAGKPIPDYYMNQIRMLQQAGLGQQGSPFTAGNVFAGAAPAQVSPTSPAQPSPEVPATGEAPTVGGEEAAEEGTETPRTEGAVEAPPDVIADPTSAESENYFDQLYGPNNKNNPFYWERRANNLSERGLTQQADAAYAEAARIRGQISETGMMMDPKGVTVTAPGVPEARTAEQLRLYRVESATKATSEQTERAQKTVLSYQVSKNTLDQAATMLAKTSTGQFAETKSYLVTALNSLGLKSDASLLEQAGNAQELRKIFSQVLFNGGLKDKIGSDIAAKELEMFSQGFGNINLEPAVNRFIVGTMRGVLDMEAKRSKDWIEFVTDRGDTPLSRKEIVNWEIKWNEDHPISEFVEQAIANTPAYGEVTPETPLENLVVGYKYVMPDGTTKVYTGEEDDNFFVDAE